VHGEWRDKGQCGDSPVGLVSFDGLLALLSVARTSGLVESRNFQSLVKDSRKV
jgi:hypothetical protein